MEYTYKASKQGKSWKYEALKNIYVNFVWWISLGNQNYPNLGKRVNDGTSEFWNQTNGGTPIKRNGIYAHQVDRISSLDLDAKI
jgi:hypothetical protein